MKEKKNSKRVIGAVMAAVMAVLMLLFALLPYLLRGLPGGPSTDGAPERIRFQGVN